MQVRLFVSGLMTGLLATLWTGCTTRQPPTTQSEPQPEVPNAQDGVEAKKARGEWAKFLKIPETKSLDLGKGVNLDVVLIPPGKFKMGSPEGDEGVGPIETQHEVEITKAFYMGVTETTQEQYEAVTGANPSCFQNGKSEQVKGKDTSKFPVDTISWDDAVKFCEKTGVKGVHLPTEAQWEYACRAGTQTKYHFGEQITDKKANFEDHLGRTVKVRTYPENAFGLFDMHGNVWEWCRDGYRSDYEKLERKDPIQKQANERRVLRGGSWWGFRDNCRAAYRDNCVHPTGRSHEGGFRVVILP